MAFEKGEVMLASDMQAVTTEGFLHNVIGGPRFELKFENAGTLGGDSEDFEQIYRVEKYLYKHSFHNNPEL